MDISLHVKDALVFYIQYHAIESLFFLYRCKNLQNAVNDCEWNMFYNLFYSYWIDLYKKFLTVTLIIIYRHLNVNLLVSFYILWIKNKTQRIWQNNFVMSYP